MLYRPTPSLPVCGSFLAKLSWKTMAGEASSSLTRWRERPAFDFVCHTPFDICRATIQCNRTDKLEAFLSHSVDDVVADLVTLSGIKVESVVESGHIRCDNDPNYHHFPADHKPQHRLSFPLIFSTPKRGISWPAIETAKKHFHPIVLISRRLPRSMAMRPLQNISGPLLIISRGSTRYDVTVIAVGVGQD